VFVRSLSALLFAALLLVSCGGEPTIVLDPPPPSTSSTTVPIRLDDDEPTSASTEPDEEPDVSVGDDWIDVTANLVGLESYCGNLAFVSANPFRDQVYVGIAGQGLFVSGPDSPEWNEFGRGEGSAPLDHRTSSIIYDPDDPDRFWESGYFGLGPPPNQRADEVNRTDDGGKTFVGLGRPVGTDLLSVDFTDPERKTLVVGAHGLQDALTSVWRSTDGGQTWEDISSNLPVDTMGEASYPHVIDAQTYLVGSHKGVAAGIYRTIDGGATWEREFAEPVAGPPLASDDGNIYWIPEEGGIVRSTDDGETWERLRNGAPAGGERRGRIVELDDGTWITMGVEYMIVSRDRGETWRAVGPELPYQPNGFTYSAIRNAVYAWQTQCSLEDAAQNPIEERAIMRLDLDLAP
jgi:photosystem II stability/assembly factor-like uncharacterized protein